MRKISFNLFASASGICAGIANINKIKSTDAVYWIYAIIAILMMMFGISRLKMYFKE